MAGTVPEDLIVQFQDAFQQFDQKGSGIISTKLLGPLLRYVGENPSEAEIQVLSPISQQARKTFT